MDDVNKKTIKTNSKLYESLKISRSINMKIDMENTKEERSERMKNFYNTLRSAGIKINEEQSKQIKGKTFVEIYGKERAEEISKNRKPKNGENNPTYGITFLYEVDTGIVIEAKPYDYLIQLKDGERVKYILAPNITRSSTKNNSIKVSAYFFKNGIPKSRVIGVIDKSTFIFTKSKAFDLIDFEKEAEARAAFPNRERRKGNYKGPFKERNQKEPQ